MIVICLQVLFFSFRFKRAIFSKEYKELSKKIEKEVKENIIKCLSTYKEKTEQKDLKCKIKKIRSKTGFDMRDLIDDIYSLTNRE